MLGILFDLYPFLLRLYADGGYQRPAFRTSVKTILAQLEGETVKRSDQVKGFIVLPKRCCGENARLVKPLPLRGQGLGVSQSQGTSFPADGFHPSHGREAMPVLEMFSGRL